MDALIATSEHDVEVENHGSIFLFFPLTPDAHEWIEENVADAAIWYAGGLAVEHRFAHDLACGMLNAGLRLS